MIRRIKKRNINIISKQLNNNKIGIIPTDTVTGIFAKISLENNKKINSLKKSKEDKPLSIIFSNLEEALKAVEYNKDQLEIIKENLPGKVTFILPSNKDFLRENNLYVKPEFKDSKLIFNSSLYLNELSDILKIETDNLISKFKSNGIFADQEIDSDTLINFRYIKKLLPKINIKVEEVEIYKELGIRVSLDYTLIQVLKKTGPLFTTSLNISGNKPVENITKRSEINELKLNTDENNKIKFFVPGKSLSSKPSTIVTFDSKNKIKLIRE